MLRPLQQLGSLAMFAAIRRFVPRVNRNIS
jgi:hypothetical protein